MALGNFSQLFQPFSFPEHLYSKRYAMKITIPKPCHENWDNMSEDEKGKFCAVCSRNVFDFTECSDEELINTFSSGSDICGRFRVDQLERDLSPSIVGKITLGLLMMSGTLMNAQESKSVEQMNVGKIAICQPSHKVVPLRIGAPVSTKERPMVLVNNKKISQEEVNKLDTKNIESVRILKYKHAVKEYGEDAKNGVLIITTKKKKRQK